MALQDLTPQLRTRLNRMERAVGWFVLLATLLLLFGFGYYLYKTAERKGWFEAKAPFYIWADRATGLKPGDPVQMMGFDVGEITEVTAAPADDWEHNVYLQFDVKNTQAHKYIGYLWTQGSRAQLTSADLLGKRVVEVTKGTNGYPIYLFNPLQNISITEAHNLPELGKWKLAEEIYDATGTNRVIKALQPLSPELLQQVAAYKKYIRVIDMRGKEGKQITGVWNDQTAVFDFFAKTNIYRMPTDESPALSERAERLVSQVEFSPAHQRSLPCFVEQHGADLEPERGGRKCAAHGQQSEHHHRAIAQPGGIVGGMVDTDKHARAIGLGADQCQRDPHQRQYESREPGG